MAMTTGALPRYPMLDASGINNIHPTIHKCIFGCSTPGISPNASNDAWTDKITFGNEGSWTPLEHDLTLEICLAFDPSSLFGENGIAPPGAVLGVLLEWTSPESSQRGYSKMARFTGEKAFDETFNLVFDPSQIRGTVDLFFSFYLVDPPRSRAVLGRYFASQKGLFLGDLPDQCKLVFDGEGSIFPLVKFCGEKGDPLWKMVFNSDNPRVNKFSIEHICLEINTRHPDYPQFEGEKEQKGHTSLRRQVFATWLTLFLLILKEKYKEIFDGLTSGSEISADPGSIAEAAKYLIETFSLDSVNTEDLAIKISNLVDSKLLDGGGVS